MALLEVLNGPNERKLFDAHRNRKNCKQIFFVVRAEEGGRPFRLYAYVDGMDYEYDVEDTWWLKLRPVKGGYQLVGKFYLPTATGSFSPDRNECQVRIEWMGLDRDVESMLVQAGKKMMVDLIVMTEFETCNLLLGQIDGRPISEPKSNELLSRTVNRFIRLRERMEVLGVSFAGTRHTGRELHAVYY